MIIFNSYVKIARGYLQRFIALTVGSICGWFFPTSAGRWSLQETAQYFWGYSNPQIDREVGKLEIGRKSSSITCWKDFSSLLGTPRYSNSKKNTDVKVSKRSGCTHHDSWSSWRCAPTCLICQTVVLNNQNKGFISTHAVYG